MHIDCNPELLEERKWERGKLPLDECKCCLFNTLCLDYSIYEESNSEEEVIESKKDCET